MGGDAFGGGSRRRSESGGRSRSASSRRKSESPDRQNLRKSRSASRGAVSRSKSREGQSFIKKIELLRKNLEVEGQAI